MITTDLPCSRCGGPLSTPHCAEPMLLTPEDIDLAALQELNRRVTTVAMENAHLQDTVSALRGQLHTQNARLDQLQSERRYWKNRVDHLEKLLQHNSPAGQEQSDE